MPSPFRKEPAVASRHVPCPPSSKGRSKSGYVGLGRTEVTMTRPLPLGQNVGMSKLKVFRIRIPGSVPTPAQKWQRWLAFITKKDGLTHYQNLEIALTKQQCKDLCGHRKTKAAPWSRKSQYVTIAYPDYKPKLTIQGN